MAVVTGKNKAVFLDRDGVINRETGEYIFETTNFEINRGVFEALSLLDKMGYMLVVVSNQGGIGKGLYTHAHVDRIHDLLKKELNKHGIELAEIYYCPHHPSTGKCLCRKPEHLLIEKAIARFNIDPESSWMTGDRERDVEAARRAGIKGILIKANDSLMNYLNVIIENDEIKNQGKATN